VKAAKLIGGIVNLVRYSVTTGIDTNSIHYTRFITHVRFFVDRYFSGDQLHGDDDGLYQQMWIMYPEAMENADKIRKYILKMNGTDISNDEVTYLGVHINRLMKTA
jgi:beta-glucoside operon transcriptional antiterminator